MDFKNILQPCPIQLNFYERKKAVYILLIIVFVNAYAIVTAGMETVLLGLKPIYVFNLILTFTSTFFAYKSLKAGSLNASVNSLIALGIYISIYIMFTTQVSNLYMHLAIVMLLSAIIHLKDYQLHVTALAINSITLYRAILSTGLDYDYLLINNRAALIGSFIIFTLTVYYLNEIINSALRSAEKYDLLSTTDALTQLNNRAKFDQSTMQYSSSKRIVVMLIDIDHFKRINDQYGHQIGDQVLVDFSRFLQSHFQGTDQIYRWGGEEFLILYPEELVDVGLNLSTTFHASILSLSTAVPSNITASIGLAQVNNFDVSNIDSAITHADHALYEAKRNGRNQTVFVQV